MRAGVTMRLAILNQIPEAPPISMKHGPQRQNIENQTKAAKLLRADIQVDQYTTAAAGKPRDQLAETCQAQLDKLGKQYPNDPLYLKTLGKFELSSGHVRESIQALEAALNQSADLDLNDYNELVIAPVPTPIKRAINWARPSRWS